MTLNNRFFSRRLGTVTAFTLILLLVGGCLPQSPDSREPVEGPTIEGQEAYHVIVAGGEPEGVAAALSAARNGMKTLLVEPGDALGGLMTLGMLNFLDMNHGPGGILLTRGIFESFYKALGNAFDVEEAKAWFWEETQKEPNLTVLLDTSIERPLMEGQTITGLVLRQGDKTWEERALAVIDATIDADVAAAAGVPYSTGGEDLGEPQTMQGVTLVFEVSGADWSAITRHVKSEGAGSGATDVAAWGYGKIAANYQPQDPQMRFRGPNIARQKDGNLLLNALLIFGVDALDPASLEEGIRRGEQEIPHIIRFMQENFPGFEAVAYEGHAPRLYVRETRHIYGEYRLTITDVLENRDHWDRIGHGSYPVDVQPTSPDNWGNVIGVPEMYSIPFRCLVPLEVDQLLVVGRSASYDSLPHGSARVIPIGMVAGEAAGVASAWSVTHGDTFREMTRMKDTAIPWVQETLKAQGAYLSAFTPVQPKVMYHWAYPGVKVMRELGLTAGGYSNDYRLEEAINHQWALENRLNKVLELAHERGREVPLRQVTASSAVTLGEVLVLTAYGMSGSQLTPPEALDYLLENEVLTSALLSHYEDFEEAPTNGQLLLVLGRAYEVLTQ